MAEKQYLVKGDTIALPAVGEPIVLPMGTLSVTRMEGTEVSMAYSYVDNGQTHTLHCEDVDLAKGPLTVGKGSDRSLIFPDVNELVDATSKTGYAGLSRLQATISLNTEGKPVYTHGGTNPIRNPGYVSPPEMVTAILPEDGSGGGFTHENREGNPRTSNEDRGLAQRAVPLKDAAAKEFLSKTYDNIILPATKNFAGGSTLSIAMRTKDQHFACTYVGDSPMFMVVQDDSTKKIRLMQIGVPHNGFGRMVQAEYAKMDLMAPTSMAQIVPFLESNLPELLKKQHSSAREVAGITHGLGRMGNPVMYPEFHIPDHIVVDPKEWCGNGTTFKGIMVCSDGIDHGVESGDVQAALTKLFALKAQPSPAEISEAAVMAARPYTRDNITAMVLPAEGRAGDLIAVADGNTKTAEVAHVAIKVLREQCQNKFMPYMVKKDSQYRVSLQGNTVSSENAHSWLDGLSQTLRQYDPAHAHQMGTHVVRDTLIIKNPTNAVRSWLDGYIREQMKCADLGRI